MADYDGIMVYCLHLSQQTDRVASCEHRKQKKANRELAFLSAAKLRHSGKSHFSSSR
jgi:hypothetical protein